MKIILIDNYDSFTYNLVQYFGELGQRVTTIRNDQASLEELIELSPDYVVVSPGPCDPDRAGISLQVIKYFAGKVPLLGVCLGHQVIGQVFGCRIIRASKVMHGKTSIIRSNKTGILRNLPAKFVATRYHSLIIDKKTLSKEIEITAQTNDGIIMGIRHKKYNVHGVQFHPESIKTIMGIKILNNFINFKN